MKRRMRTWLLKCRHCGRTEKTHSLEMLAWAEAECCGEGCMEAVQVD